MSQPPQQPGPYGGQPPGWGQQPGPGQQPGGYPQQGGYPQSGGYPQPGGYPQSGPQPVQQPDPYAQQGQYGQQPPYGQPGPYGPPPGAPKKSKMPWILAGGGVVVIGVVVVLILVLTGGSGTSSPQGIAEEIAKVVNARDTEGAKKLYCDPAVASKSSEIGDLNDVPQGMSFSAKAGKVTENGDTGTAQVILTVSQSGQTQNITINFDLKKKDGSWCVTGSKADLGGSTGGS